MITAMFEEPIQAVASKLSGVNATIIIFVLVLYFIVLYCITITTFVVVCMVGSYISFSNVFF